MFSVFRPFAPFDAFRAPNLADTPIPDPDLALPLQGSLLPSTGTGTLTHTRATSAWMWRDSDGRMWRDYAAGRVLIECPAGELRVEGARRVRNLLAYSESGVGVVAEGTSPPTIVASSIYSGRICCSISFPGGVGGYSASRAKFPATGVFGANTYFCRLEVAASRPLVESEQIRVYFPLSPEIDVVAFNASNNIGSSFSTIAKPGIVFANSANRNLMIYPTATLTAPITIYISGRHLENTTGLTNQSAPEYLSTGVLSYPFHGAGADGVKYYSTLSNGTPILASEIKAVVETAATNLLLNSATLTTQNVTVTAQPYTLSFRGTGSVTLSGTATGTLTGTGEHNRVQLTFTPTAGTLTLTVSGSVTTAVLRTGTTAGTYIPTTTATVQRHADQLVLTNYTLPATGTLYFEAEARDWSQVNGQLFGDDTEYLLKPLTNNSGIQAFDGTNTANGPTGTPSGTMRFAVRWNATTGKMRLAANGTLGIESDYDGNWNLASYILAGGFDGAIRNLRTYDRALTDAQMRRLTA